MAEPGRAADETVVGKTVAVPNSTPTDAVELAWSTNYDPTDDRERIDDRNADKGLQNEPADVRQSWRSTWGKAAALLVAGLGLAGAIILGHWVLAGPQSPIKAAESPSSTATAPPTAAGGPTGPAGATASSAPSSIASTPDQDKKYVQSLNDKGISFANPEAAVFNGKMVCDDIRQGMTVQQIVDAFRSSNPDLANNANTYVAISVRAYCPQNSNLLPAGS
jgi:hypothetical protein